MAEQIQYDWQSLKEKLKASSSTPNKTITVDMRSTVEDIVRKNTLQNTSPGIYPVLEPDKVDSKIF